MPKVFLPKAIPPGVFLLSEDLWFRRYQELLLAMANTKFGRELLCISQDYPRIIYIDKNCVHYLIDRVGPKYIIGADFRVGGKWGNVIRSRWDEFNSYARYFVSGDHKSNVGLSSSCRFARSIVCATLVAYPDPHTETYTVDGYVNKEGGGAWSTHHDALTGDGANDNSSTMIVSSRNDGTDYQIRRIFILFDTSSLTISAGITSGTVRLYQISAQKLNTDNDGQDYYSIIGPTSPASNTALVTADFDQCGSISNPTKMSDDIDAGVMASNTYQTFTLNTAGKANISLTGITKFGCREGHDQENASIASSTTNQEGFQSADTSGTSQDTELSIVYIAFILPQIERTPIRGVMRGVMRP